MRKICLIFMSLSLAVSAFANGTSEAGGSGATSSKPILLKIGCGLPEAHYSTQSYYLLEKYVEAQTNGAIDVQIFPANQLGVDKEVVEMVQQGIVQMNPTGSSALSLFEPSFSMFSMPYLFKNQEDVQRLLTGEFGQKLLATLEDQGMVGLGFGFMGFTNISNSVRPIETADDLEGLKIRCVTNPLLLDFFTEVGAKPVPMSFSELFSAMQQGVVDGQFNPLTTIYTNKFHEVQDYISLTSDIASLVVYVVSLDFWESLSPEFQTIVREGVKISQDYMLEQVELAEQNSYDSLVNSGQIKINEVSNETKAELFKRGLPIIEKYGKESNAELFEILKKELGL